MLLGMRCCSVQSRETALDCGFIFNFSNVCPPTPYPRRCFVTLDVKKGLRTNRCTTVSSSFLGAFFTCALLPRQAFVYPVCERFALKTMNPFFFPHPSTSACCPFRLFNSEGIPNPHVPDDSCFGFFPPP